MTAMCVMGCQDAVLVPVEFEYLPEPECPWRSCPALDPNDPAVDVLVVVGDGPTMATVQERLREAMPAFARGLASTTVPTDLRVGFTRGSAGHPACERVADGRLELLNECGFDDPWIDWRVGEPGADIEGLRRALECAARLETDGCAFQSPLRAPVHTIVRARAESEPEFGFFRDRSSTLIVTVTDSFDCSVGPNPAAFDPDGERALWSDPMTDAPTPAVCWRAGTRCWLDEEGAIERCEPGDLDELGDRTFEPSEATLRPVAKLAGTIESLHGWHQALQAGSEHRLLLLAGVPPDWATGSPLPLSVDTDVERQAEYGIGSGCNANGVVALPPLRALQAFEAITQGTSSGGTVASVCAQDYGGLLEAEGAEIASAGRADCLPFCVADSDPDLAGLQPDCTFWYYDADRYQIPVPACDDPDAADASPCFIYRTEEALNPRCAEDGWNAEVEFVATGPIPPGATVGFGCELSRDKDADCPGLP
jgi:hypothetical protein